MSASDPISEVEKPSQISSVTNMSPYAGMTVNERLFDAGLMEAFGNAMQARDRAEMIRLLAKVDVADAIRSVDEMLRNPTHYGI